MILPSLSMSLFNVSLFEHMALSCCLPCAPFNLPPCLVLVSLSVVTCSSRLSECSSCSLLLLYGSPFPSSVVSLLS